MNRKMNWIINGKLESEKDFRDPKEDLCKEEDKELERQEKARIFTKAFTELRNNWDGYGVEAINNEIIKYILD